MSAHTLQNIEFKKYEIVFFNYASALVLSYLSLLFYTQAAPYFVSSYSAYWEPQIVGWQLGFTITSSWILKKLFIVYAFLLPFYFAIQGNYLSKSSLVVVGVSKYITRGFYGQVTEQEKQALCGFLIKFFFIPFIVNASVAHFRELNYKSVDLYRYYVMDIYERPFFIKDITQTYFQIIFALIYTFDIVPFIVGYLVEADRMHNKIKSTETTWRGWFFCAICYPPINSASASFAPTQIPDYVQPFVSLGRTGDYLAIAANVLAALLLACYASASVSLGWKASNLTSRGVVQSGLYKYVRHPAYVCKNAAWWVFSLSWAYQASEAGQPYIFNLLCLCTWTWIYAQRALTEEQHLMRSDSEYLTYMQSVRYRFIPFLI